MTQKADQQQDNNDRLNQLIGSSGDIAGAAIGGALGFLAAGPAGAALGSASGAAAASAIKKIGAEVSDRLLGSREKIRVGGVLAIAANHIRNRIERGEQLRNDGFFRQNESGRSDAEEVAESVLLKSQREAEERKIPFMAFLIGNVAFDAQISPQLAHQIIKSADAMTYRQLCILKLAALKENYALRTQDYRDQGHFERNLYEILYECLDLYHRGFINFGGGVAFGPTDVKPNGMSIQGIGVDVFSQMGLATIPQSDIDQIVERLSS